MLYKNTVAGLLQVILTVRDEEKWYRSVRDVIVRLYERLLKPFFWHTRLGRQYTAIIGWGLQYMFHGAHPQHPNLPQDMCFVILLVFLSGSGSPVL